MDANIRKNKRIYIVENIIDINEKQLTKLYEIISDLMHTEKDVLDRQHMLSYVENNLKYVEGNDLIVIKDMVAGFVANEESDEDKMKRVTLEIINKILRAIGKKEINELEEFVDIPREDILSDSCKNVMDDNKDYIFENGFNKTECMLYQTKIKVKHLSILKAMLKKIGYKLHSIHSGRRINGKKKPYTTYTITKQ